MRSLRERPQMGNAFGHLSREVSRLPGIRLQVEEQLLLASELHEL